MSNVSTTLQPVILVDGDGNPINIAFEVPNAFTASQALAAAALDATDAFAFNKKVLWLAIHIDGAGLVNAQTLTITFDSADGAAFDTIHLREVLPAGTTDKWYSFPCDTLLRAADHIRTQLTNAGAAETATARMTLMFAG